MAGSQFVCCRRYLYLRFKYVYTSCAQLHPTIDGQLLIGNTLSISRSMLTRRTPRGAFHGLVPWKHVVQYCTGKEKQVWWLRTLETRDSLVCKGFIPWHQKFIEDCVALRRYLSEALGVVVTSSCKFDDCILESVGSKSTSSNAHVTQDGLESRKLWEP